VVVGLEVTPIEDLGLGAASSLFFFFVCWGGAFYAETRGLRILG